VSTYLLDHAWAGERERLEGLSAVFDPGTFRVLEEVGSAQGGASSKWVAVRSGGAVGEEPCFEDLKDLVAGVALCPGDAAALLKARRTRVAAGRVGGRPG
jgi:hypothetical protein